MSNELSRITLGKRNKFNNSRKRSNSRARSRSRSRSRSNNRERSDSRGKETINDRPISQLKKNEGFQKITWDFHRQFNFNDWKLKTTKNKRTNKFMKQCKVFIKQIVFDFESLNYQSVNVEIICIKQKIGQ